MLQFFSVSFSKACLEIENLEMTMLQFFSVSLSNAFSRDSVSFLIGTMNMFCTKGLYQKQWGDHKIENNDYQTMSTYHN